MYPFIIIGTGAAGLAAAEAIRTLDEAAEIIMVGEESAGHYSRPGLAFYLKGEIPQEQLFPLTEADFQRLKVLRMRGRVVRIIPDDHCIQLNNGRSLYYQSLLIATGAIASPSRLLGAELEGVVKLDCLQDAVKILDLARKARSAVVVGGGITALELVEGMVARGLTTHYLLRGDHYWSNVLDEEESRIVEDRLREDNVTIHYQTELVEIIGKNGRVTGGRIKDGQEIKCDMVAVAVGITPRAFLAEKADIKVGKGILVSETLQTSQPDIFAAGDVAQVYDPITGKTVLESLWGPARSQGFAAGLNMAGRRTVYKKRQAFNVTRLANLTTTIIGRVGGGIDLDLVGIARGDSETWREMPDAIATQANFDVNHLRLLVGKDILVGAVLIGSQTLSTALQVLIERKVDISSIRDELLHPNARLADVIADFWCQWNDREGENVKQ